VSPLRAFLSVMVGYLVNIPTARLGEVARCIILKKMTHVPIETSLGAIVAERIIDLVMLATLAILTILLEFDKIGSFVLKNLQQAAHFSINSNVIVATAFFIAFTLLLAWRFRKKLCHHPFTHKMLKIVYGLKNGFLAIRKLSFRQRVFFLFFTALIWVCYFLMSYFLFFSRPDTSFLGLRCALAVLVMSGLGVTLPTPGGIGSYHLFVSFTLTAYGLNEKIAKSFAFLMHSSQLITIVIVGFFALAISSFLSAEKKVSSLVV
ncbi:MAG: flippase-like domain-containing protein, partial [Flammeovirgaceae bacterium]|nr:flippase-like domain-containing protein [Flammeovirgaceae bacterium]MDW8288323.1 lysylphosphatidylglycerol synthase transmembrane domain-containing protein [Flammeovirgaceae bacterium]